MPLGIALAERGLLPDAIVRAGIRRLCAKRLGRHLVDHEAKTQSFLSSTKHASIAPVPEKANEQHYEMPPDLFALTLGKRLKYSCGYWPEGVTTLDESEDAALALVAQRAELQDGMDILDLGCGWGSLSLFVAEKYPNCNVTSVSNSHLQRRYIVEQAERKGWQGRVHVVTADMNELSLDGKYDRILSIEMFEHMRNHAELLKRIERWLRSDGALFVHVFCHRLVSYPFDVDGEDDWMAQHFFTGGMMPSMNWLSFHDQHLRVASNHWLSGVHYERTCNAWLQRMTRNRSQVMAILRSAHGDNASIWFHRWRIFYMACAELFGFDHGEQWGVSHTLLRKA